jgi:hypothetical protein
MGGSGGAAGAAGSGGGGGANGGSAGAGGNTGGAGGTSGGAGGASGAGAGGGGNGGPDHLPADYQGTPFAVLPIPGTFFAADYDEGGPGVAYCHGNENDCAAGINTGDWYPPGSPMYRPDNVGLCRMNPGKPDNTTEGVPVTDDVYVGYMAGGQWMKYTVEVAEAGTYSIDMFTGAPGNTISLDFGDGITTGDFQLPASPTGNCNCTESYHSWAMNEDLATVTFPEAGTYLMTFTTNGSMNLDTFTFTKM